MARLWILGAADPEMAAIETLLRQFGEKTAFATLRGQRVTPGTAYTADGQTCDSLEGLEEVILVECELPEFFAGDPAPKVSHVDHHYAGDPGYGKGPEDFLRASSIGQTYLRLNTGSRFELTKLGWGDAHEMNPESGDPGSILVLLPKELVLTAAADHCLAHAYDGECPGVNPDELMAWRAASRAAFQKRTVEAVLADVAAARDALATAPEVRIAGAIKDLRGKSVPELPEAAARDGVAFLAEMKEKDGRTKVVLQAAAPDQIEAFMKYWAPDQGLTDIYGDPRRGFCGAYKK